MSENMVTRIGRWQKHYERGDDVRKEDHAWPGDAINRIRFEYTANRQALRRHHITTLLHLLADTKFFEMCNRRWQFRRFTSKKLPRVHEPFREGCFHGEFLAAKRRGTLRNLSKAMAPGRKLAKREYDMIVAMIDFDKTWSDTPT